MKDERPEAGLRGCKGLGAAFARNQLAYYREMMGIPDTSAGGMSPKVRLPPLHCGFDAISAEQAECLRQWATSAVLADRERRAGLIEELLADAKRYRWLRERHRVLARMECASGLGLDLRRVYVDTAEKLDAAIDAALAEQRAGEAP